MTPEFADLVAICPNRRLSADEMRDSVGPLYGVGFIRTGSNGD
jgi:hypothetical protein